MAMSSNCCLNILPPLPDSNSIPTVKSLPSRRKSPKLVMGGLAACAIIGLEMGMPNIDLIITHETSLFNSSSHALASELTKPSKWSDKRSCPPWNLNSLETIVPENLPRPSAHRRWEAVAYDSLGHPIAKTIILLKSKPACFSM